MPETPRTWTLEMSPSGCDGEDFHVQALGPDVGWDEKPEVIEKAPVDAEREVVEKERDAAELRAQAILGHRADSAVLYMAAKRDAESARDAERERLLDLLADIFLAYAADCAMDSQIGIPVEALLREYGRLGKGES